MLRIDILVSLVKWTIALFKHRSLRVTTAYGLSDGNITNKDSSYKMKEMKVNWLNDINDPKTWMQYRLQVPVCVYINDTVFLESSKYRMQKIVDIANEFYLINDIDINTKKSEMIIINPIVERYEQTIELDRDHFIVQATD
ncbi:hypothetical protein RhiirC2_802869 [Rhizophagus irregularis]|uniref:Reverse transcriptase domain-containing protein n=1 Tax=Rhizophagus irregularis TaxID=588596 RepID=A0A2N1M0W9_9GLOM|nr:hypothetical protein RhiirC2_802869 [Rhizophagus irregularis]